MRAHDAFRVGAFGLLLAGAVPFALSAQTAQLTQSAQPGQPVQPGQPAPPTQPVQATPAPVQVAPAPAAVPSGGGAASAQPAQPAAPPPAWLPRQTAELQIVEKVNATYRTLDVAVGKTAKVDRLAIAVKACVVRPPDQQRDAAAYLDITGKGAQAPSFRGWMLAAEPAVSLFKDPLYDVRVIGCR